MYEIFVRSISISISRSIPILSPIFLIILLAEFRPDWVTPFSLCFSVLSIVCVLPILLGIVIQIDNERYLLTLYFCMFSLFFMENQYFGLMMHMFLKSHMMFSC